MISKVPHYPSTQLRQLNQLSHNPVVNNKDNNNSTNIQQVKGRIEGDGMYNNHPTVLPNKRPHFNCHHEELTTKPNNYLDKIIKESKVVQKNNHYETTLNKARSMKSYLTPFAFSCFSDKKSLPVVAQRSFKDEYCLKEMNDSLLKSFMGNRSIKLNEALEESQHMPSNNRKMHHSLSCLLYSNSLLNNYSTGVLSLKSSSDEEKEEEKTRHTILSSKLSDTYQTPTFVKKSLSDNFHSVMNLSCLPEYSFRQFHNEKYNLCFDQRETVIDRVSDMPYEGLFCLFDGHSNTEIAEYCKDHFPLIFQRQLDYNPQTVYPFINPNNKPSNSMPQPLPPKSKRGQRTSTETLLVKAFLKLDDEIKYFNKPESGCCACVVFLTKEMEKIGNVPSIRKYLYCANVGDIQCVLLTKNSVRCLSTLHDTDNSLEIKRLRETGGVLYQDKVFGHFQFTRAFGHHKLKAYGITSIPDVRKYLIEEHRDKYLVIGTKGVFQYLKAEDILYFSQSLSKTEDIVNKVINHAIMNGSRDNLSCFVMKL